MKTKNIFLLPIAILILTLLSTPASALFNDEYRDKVNAIADTITTTIKNSIKEKSYLDVESLKTDLKTHKENFDSKYLHNLWISASNSIKDNKISDREQYDLMVLAIKTNHNEVLQKLLMVGFYLDIDVKLNDRLQEGEQKFRSLIAEAVINDNRGAFREVFHPDIDEIHNFNYIIEELQYDESLIDRYVDFASLSLYEDPLIEEEPTDKNGALSKKAFKEIQDMKLILPFPSNLPQHENDTTPNNR